MENLLDLFQKHIQENDLRGQQLLTKVSRCYKRANKTYVESDSFTSRVEYITELVSKEPKKMWVIAKDFFQELKAHNLKPSTSDDSTGPSTSAQADQTSENGTTETSTESASQSQIARLEKLLEEHRKAINELENAELSLDDLDSEDSTYLTMNRLKVRATKIFKKLCTLKNRSTNMGGVRERQFRYRGSRYKEINATIGAFINKHSFEERMPDYRDIRRIVMKCNLKFGYSLTTRRCDELAKEIFTDVGNMLSDIRRQDFTRDFGPPEAARAILMPTEDPATLSYNLREQLNSNQKQAEKNMKSLLAEFSEQQEREATQDKVSGAEKESADEHEDESEDESEEEGQEDEEGEVELALGITTGEDNSNAQTNPKDDGTDSSTSTSSDEDDNDDDDDDKHAEVLSDLESAPSDDEDNDDTGDGVNGGTSSPSPPSKRQRTDSNISGANIEVIELIDSD